MKKFLRVAPMSWYMVGTHLGIHLKNQRETKSWQLRVKEKGNLKTYLNRHLLNADCIICLYVSYTVSITNPNICCYPYLVWCW